LSRRQRRVPAFPHGFVTEALDEFGGFFGGTVAGGVELQFPCQPSFQGRDPYLTSVKQVYVSQTTFEFKKTDLAAVRKGYEPLYFGWGATGHYHQSDGKP
jgi:hypothetical protein